MSNRPDLEKGGAVVNETIPLDFEDGGHYHLEDTEDTGAAVRKIRTAGSISISPELFEKIYLSHKSQVSGDIRTTFANPTPLCIVGFVISLTPLSNVLMGWRGAGNLGAAEVGAFFFFCGLLSTIGAVMEFVLGNTFSFIVFGSFDAFWLTYSVTLTPFYNASIAYDPAHPATAAEDPNFVASYAFFLLYMGLLCIIFLICSLRTNICFVLIFLTLVLTFACLAGSDWQAAQGHADRALTLQQAGGGMAFTSTLLGWYVLFVQMLASVDFPFLELPVGDLSTVFKGGSERKR